MKQINKYRGTYKNKNAPLFRLCEIFTMVCIKKRIQNVVLKLYIQAIHRIDMNYFKKEQFEYHNSKKIDIITIYFIHIKNKKMVVKFTRNLIENVH